MKILFKSLGKGLLYPVLCKSLVEPSEPKKPVEQKKEELEVVPTQEEQKRNAVVPIKKSTVKAPKLSETTKRTSEDTTPTQMEPSTPSTSSTEKIGKKRKEQQPRSTRSRLMQPGEEEPILNTIHKEKKGREEVNLVGQEWGHENISEEERFDQALEFLKGGFLSKKMDNKLLINFLEGAAYNPRHKNYDKEKLAKIAQFLGLTDVNDLMKIETAKDFNKINEFLLAADKKKQEELEKEQPDLTDVPSPLATRTKRLLQTAPIKGPITTTGAGANGSFIINLANGTKGVWKPRYMESEYCRKYTAGDQYTREAASYDIASSLGLDNLVPMTVVRKIGGKIGSFQKFEKGTVAAVIWDEEKRYGTEQSLAAAAACDCLLGSDDRHDGNWLVSDSGNIILIDNGMTFFPAKGWSSDGRLIYDEARKRKLAIPEEVKNWQWDKIEEILRGYGIPSEAIHLTKLRFNVLKEKATFDQIPKDIV